jgi:putative transposase
MCIVHQTRYSLTYVFYKNRKAVATNLKATYQAATVEEAELRLAEFAENWDSKHPRIAKS